MCTLLLLLLFFIYSCSWRKRPKWGRLFSEGEWHFALLWLGGCIGNHLVSAAMLVMPGWFLTPRPTPTCSTHLLLADAQTVSGLEVGGHLSCCPSFWWAEHGLGFVTSDRMSLQKCLLKVGIMPILSPLSPECSDLQWSQLGPSHA
jgi:hypothetical protein